MGAPGSKICSFDSIGDILRDGDKVHASKAVKKPRVAAPQEPERVGLVPTPPSQPPPQRSRLPQKSSLHRPFGTSMLASVHRPLIRPTARVTGAYIEADSDLEEECGPAADRLDGMVRQPPPRGLNGSQNAAPQPPKPGGVLSRSQISKIKTASKLGEDSLCKPFNDLRSCRNGSDCQFLHACDAVLESGQVCGSESHARTTHNPSKHGRVAMK